MLENWLWHNNAWVHWLVLALIALALFGRWRGPFPFGWGEGLSVAPARRAVSLLAAFLWAILTGAWLAGWRGTFPGWSLAVMAVMVLGVLWDAFRRDEPLA